MLEASQPFPSLSFRSTERLLPGPLYCDSSALVKLYLPETESDELDRILTGRRDLIVSDLCVAEIISTGLTVFTEVTEVPR